MLKTSKVETRINEDLNSFLEEIATQLDDLIVVGAEPSACLQTRIIALLLVMNPKIEIFHAKLTFINGQTWTNLENLKTKQAPDVVKSVVVLRDSMTLFDTFFAGVFQKKLEKTYENPPKVCEIKFSNILPLLEANQQWTNLIENQDLQEMIREFDK
jgi:hypothetical protein